MSTKGLTQELNQTIAAQLKSGHYTHIPCNLCGHDDAALYAAWKPPKIRVHIRRVKCRQCGFVYSDPQATNSILKQFYDGCYNGDDLDATISQKSKKLAGYRRFFLSLSQRRPAGKFLDVGCSTGHVLSIGREFGWEVYGVDLSPSVVRYAQNKFGLSNVQQLELSDANYSCNFFDYVFLSHVLEHVSDPTALLTEIFRILKPGGELRVAVPCLYDPIYYTFRLANRIRGSLPHMSSDHAHTCEFTPSTLVKLLRTTGFGIRRTALYYNALETILPKEGWKSRMAVKFWWYVAKLLPNKFGHRLEVDAFKATSPTRELDITEKSGKAFPISSGARYRPE